MKIVRIHGGLGNQMFQYALAVALKCSNHSESVYIDYSCMNGYNLHNGFELSRIFNLNIKQAPWYEILRVGLPLPHYRLWQIGSRINFRNTCLKDDSIKGFNPNVFQERDLLLEGAWQTDRYFSRYREDILKAFTFPDFVKDSENDRLLHRINGKVSVSLHVRRGDYLKISNTAGICSNQYYKSGIDYIKSKVSPDCFVIFSDDIEWCKSNIMNWTGNADVMLVDWNKGGDSYRDMQLMSLCRHNIIANSSFSWWGAWLNDSPDKVVVAPSRWMNNGECPDICSEDWHAI